MSFDSGFFKIGGHVVDRGHAQVHANQIPARPFNFDLDHVVGKTRNRSVSKDNTTVLGEEIIKFFRSFCTHQNLVRDKTLGDAIRTKEHPDRALFTFTHDGIGAVGK